MHKYRRSLFGSTHGAGITRFDGQSLAQIDELNGLKNSVCQRTDASLIYCHCIRLGSSQFRSLLLNMDVVADYQSEKYSLMTLLSDPPSQRFRGMPLWAFVLLMLLALGAWLAWNVYIDYHNVLEQE
jgi:hypothetical protein